MRVFRAENATRSLGQDEYKQVTRHPGMPTGGNLPVGLQRPEAERIKEEEDILRRHIHSMELEYSLQEAMIVVSRRFEAKLDPELPPLVQRAKDELAELELKEQEQWDGLEAIRVRHRAELREERKQQRRIERLQKFAQLHDQGRRRGKNLVKEHARIVRYQ